jgi:hypothetical protein
MLFGTQCEFLQQLERSRMQAQCERSLRQVSAVLTCNFKRQSLTESAIVLSLEEAADKPYIELQRG